MKYKEAEEALLKEEFRFDNIKTPDIELKAMGYTCLAHDWFQMGEMNKGFSLLSKAENTCPGYFQNEMKKQVEQYEYFAPIVRNMAAEIIFMTDFEGTPQ